MTNFINDELETRLRGGACHETCESVRLYVRKRFIKICTEPIEHFIEIQYR